MAACSNALWNGDAGFLPVLTAEFRALKPKILQAMRKILSLVKLAGKVAESLAAGRTQVKNLSATVLETGLAALDSPMFSGGCFPAPVGCSSQSTL